MISLENKQIELIKDKLYKHCGIFLSDSKLTMIKNRIYRLMQDTRVNNIDELLLGLEKDNKIKQLFINSFTTNKTEFFREELHFEDMLHRALPVLFRRNRPIRIYCCASSSGQEPYSIAMSALYAKSFYRASTPINIIATDIDTQMLQEAKEGIYTINFRIDKFPQWIELEAYFDKIDESKNTFKAKNALKSMISFKQLNLFDSRYPFMRDEFDILFCRNVLIYFKQADQRTILSRLVDTLRIDGTFYLGHSESLYDLENKFEKLGNKTFVKIKG